MPRPKAPTPRPGTIPADIADYLRRRSKGSTVAEIAEGLRGVRRTEVLQHSVRSALFQHLDERGARLFVRVARARYALRK